MTAERYPIMPGAEPWSSPGSGDRATVGIVVSHGFSGSPIATRALGEALAAKGFAVEVIRLPGHGTDWRDMARTRYDDWRGEVERAAAALAKRVKRVLVVGLSMGGTIAIDLACSRPDLFAGAVPINATVLDREGLLAKIAPALAYVVPVAPASMAGLVKNDIAKGGEEKAYGMVPLKAGNSLLVELARIREGLARLEVPMVVAYSPQDHSVPPENSKAIVRMTEGKDVTALVLERSYHVATMDYDMDLIVEATTKLGDRVRAV
jgi:carboxylesterase